MSGAISRAGPYTQLANDSNSGNDFRGVAGAGLRQFPECVPEPLAGGRERGEAALALPPLQPYAGLVGECATGELAGAAREMPGVRGVDWVAVSTGGSGGGWALGVASLAVLGYQSLDILVFNLRSPSTLVSLIGWVVFQWLLVALAVLDAENLWLPDWLTLPGIALGSICTVLKTRRQMELSALSRPQLTSGVLDCLFAILAAAALILLIRWVYWVVRHREGIGYGDAKLMALLAAWLGLPQALLAFAVGVVLGALAAVVLLAVPAGRRGPESWASSKLPLGTFLCVGGIVSCLWGQPIVAAYLRWGGF